VEIAVNNNGSSSMTMGVFQRIQGNTTVVAVPIMAAVAVQVTAFCRSSSYANQWGEPTTLSSFHLLSPFLHQAPPRFPRH
jgi:hypothetical protein